MQNYWEGGVSAILSQNQPSRISNDVKINRNAAKAKRRKKTRLCEDTSENKLLKCEKASVSLPSDNKFTGGKDSCKNRGNILPDDNNETSSSSVLKNVGEKTCDNSEKALKGNNKVSPEIDKTDFTIFVGNLPLSYGHKKVVKLFSKFGEVENARIRCVPVANASIQKKTSAITKKFHPSRDSAVAYVVFKSKDSVVKAIAQNGMVLNGHHLRIDSAVSKKADPNKSVFVGGLPFDVKDNELWDLFKDCGEIDYVRVVRDKNISMGKGFGYISFKSIASVELALKLNGREIRNRKINVERCLHKKRKKNPSTDFPFHTKRRKRDNEKFQAKANKTNKTKSKKDSSSNEFQGRTAEQKSKKKKKSLTKDAARRNRIKSVFSPSSSTNGKKNVKGGKKS